MSTRQTAPSNAARSRELREFEAVLRERAREWSERLERIQRDRRRESGPLDPDFAEQATQRENDETLDLLDAEGRRELAAIDAALARIDAGRFGLCQSCEEPIAIERLRVQPDASECLECAREREARAGRAAGR